MKIPLRVLLITVCINLGFGLSVHAQIPDDLLKSANSGSAESQCMVGILYLKGEGVDQDTQKGIQWLERSADQDFTPAMLTLAGLIAAGGVESKGTSDMLKLLERAGNLGESKALFHLGMFYFSGETQKKNIKKAIPYFEKAAEMGNVEAMYALGFIYKQGDGVKKNIPKALELFTKAAEAGEEKSQILLCETYMYGLDVEKDPEKAFYWGVKAAASGKRTVALYDLGRIYEKGIGVKADRAMAAKYMTQAAERGYPPALNDLSDYYFKGKGVPVDPDKGMKLLKAAAEQGVRMAQLKLGERYKDGNGVEVDYVIAYKWISLGNRSPGKWARTILEDCQSKMTAQQIKQAKRLADEWAAKEVDYNTRNFDRRS